MNIFQTLQEAVIRAVRKLPDLKLDDAVLKAISVSPPREKKFGCAATNAAMVIAGSLKQNPRAIAQQLTELLADEIPSLEKTEIAGPGFINLYLKSNIWQELLAQILAEGDKYGKVNLGNGEKINVEFASPNPTGPVHIGHARGAVYGDVLSEVLSWAGYEVVRENYVNDAGGQINILAKSVHLRYLEVAGKGTQEIPDGLYPGEYLIPVAEELFVQYGDKFTDCDEAEYIDIFKEFTVGKMVDMIKSDLGYLNIKHDVFSSELALHKAKKIEAAVEFLGEKGQTYRGVLEPPKGKKLEDWEAREQLLFKASEYGDDVDRPLQKSDGSWTYFAADAAYHYDKISRGFNKMVLCLGADHGGYVKRMKALIKALSDNKATIEIRLCQLVNFLKGGEVVKMSKRNGSYVTVREVVEEIGADVIRFIMLTRKNDAVLDFDLAKVTEQSKDNPVFYVQYAHARCASILRNSGELADKALDVQLLEKLNSEADIDLIKAIATFPKIIEGAALNYEPHRVAFYLQEVASEFHSFWNKGKDDGNLRFITDDESQTLARLSLVKAVQLTIANGLRVMGVTPLHSMH